MNKDIVKGHWHEIKGKLRQQWSELTDDDIQHMQGSYEELSGKLQKKFGYQKEQADREIENFLRKNRWLQ